MESGIQTDPLRSVENWYCLFRWWIIQRNVLLKPLIKPVPDAIASVSKELRQIQETGMGRLYIISGVTGSGKTTFLNSLHYFLDDVDIHTAS